MKVVYEATRNFYKYLPGAIASLLDHNDPEVVYVLAEDDHIDGLPDVCRVIDVTGQPWISETSPNWKTFYSWMVLIRVCMPEILKHEDKVLQLDVDTIVCDSLEDLWNTDMDGKWFGMVPEYESAYRPFGPVYYNAGVLLFNLKQLRLNNIMPVMVTDLNTMFHPYPEQDVMNMYGQGFKKIVDLPVRYNTSYCCGLVEHPAIIHFAGIPNWTELDGIIGADLVKKYHQPPCC